MFLHVGEDRKIGLELPIFKNVFLNGPKKGPRVKLSGPQMAEIRVHNRKWADFNTEL